MKKLMVLALVLSVAGIVNAGIQLVKIDDSTAAVVNETDGYNYKGWIAIEKTLAVALEITASGNPNGQSSYGDSYLWSEDLGLLWTNFAVNSLDPAKKVKAGQNILITRLQGEGMVYLYNEAGDTVIGEARLIPEPMTMGLLALGGLFIRRKK